MVKLLLQALTQLLTIHTISTKLKVYNYTFPSVKTKSNIKAIDLSYYIDFSRADLNNLTWEHRFGQVEKQSYSYKQVTLDSTLLGQSKNLKMDLYDPTLFSEEDTARMLLLEVYDFGKEICYQAEMTGDQYSFWTAPSLNSTDCALLNTRIELNFDPETKIFKVNRAIVRNGNLWVFSDGARTPKISKANFDDKIALSSLKITEVVEIQKNQKSKKSKNSKKIQKKSEKTNKLKYNTGEPVQPFYYQRASGSNGVYKYPNFAVILNSKINYSVPLIPSTKTAQSTCRGCSIQWVNFFVKNKIDMYYWLVVKTPANESLLQFYYYQNRQNSTTLEFNHTGFERGYVGLVSHLKYYMEIEGVKNTALVCYIGDDEPIKYSDFKKYGCTERVIEVNLKAREYIEDAYLGQDGSILVRIFDKLNPLKIRYAWSYNFSRVAPAIDFTQNVYTVYDDVRYQASLYFETGEDLIIYYYYPNSTAYYYLNSDQENKKNSSANLSDSELMVTDSDGSVTVDLSFRRVEFFYETKIDSESSLVVSFDKFEKRYEYAHRGFYFQGDFVSLSPIEQANNSLFIFSPVIFANRYHAVSNTTSLPGNFSVEVEGAGNRLKNDLESEKSKIFKNSKNRHFGESGPNSGQNWQRWGMRGYNKTIFGDNASSKYLLLTYRDIEVYMDTNQRLCWLGVKFNESVVKYGSPYALIIDLLYLNITIGESISSSKYGLLVIESLENSVITVLQFYPDYTYEIRQLTSQHFTTSLKLTMDLSTPNAGSKDYYITPQSYNLFDGFRSLKISIRRLYPVININKYEVHGEVQQVYHGKIAIGNHTFELTATKVDGFNGGAANFSKKPIVLRRKECVVNIRDSISFEGNLYFVDRTLNQSVGSSAPLKIIDFNSSQFDGYLDNFHSFSHGAISDEYSVVFQRDLGKGDCFVVAASMYKNGAKVFFQDVNPPVMVISSDFVVRYNNSGEVKDVLMAFVDYNGVVSLFHQFINHITVISTRYDYFGLPSKHINLIENPFKDNAVILTRLDYNGYLHISELGFNGRPTMTQIYQSNTTNNNFTVESAVFSITSEAFFVLGLVRTQKVFVFNLTAFYFKDYSKRIVVDQIPLNAMFGVGLPSNRLKIASQLDCQPSMARPGNFECTIQSDDYLLIHFSGRVSAPPFSSDAVENRKNAKNRNFGKNEKSQFLGENRPIRGRNRVETASQTSIQPLKTTLTGLIHEYYLPSLFNEGRCETTKNFINCEFSALVTRIYPFVSVKTFRMFLATWPKMTSPYKGTGYTSRIKEIDLDDVCSNTNFRTSNYSSDEITFKTFVSSRKDKYTYFHAMNLTSAGILLQVNLSNYNMYKIINSTSLQVNLNPLTNKVYTVGGLGQFDIEIDKDDFLEFSFIFFGGLIFILISYFFLKYCWKKRTDEEDYRRVVGDRDDEDDGYEVESQIFDGESHRGTGIDLGRGRGLGGRRRNVSKYISGDLRDVSQDFAEDEFLTEGE